MTKICMIGTGYVGLVTGSCLADFGNHVVCVDIDQARIQTLEDGGMPIYEPGLRELVARNYDSGRISFSTDLAAAVRGSDVVFIAVGTPSLPDGGTDLTYVMKAAEDAARHLEGYTVIVQKSTSPVGTARRIAGVVARHATAGVEFDVVSNPEFLREGSAIEDFMRPNRVVIGVETDRARAVMKEVYRPLFLLETPIVDTTLETAEMIKYASNSYLATKISFINEMATICELVGANIDDVARGMGLDGRIGRKFLHAGIGYGGSCLPKDVKSLLHVAAAKGYDAALVRAAEDINNRLVSTAVAKLEGAVGGLKGKTIGLLGLAFKPNTDDLREAPSLRLVAAIASAGARIKAFDPIAMENFRRTTEAKVEYCKNAYDTAEDCDAVLLVTEWNEFRELDFARMKRLMKGRVFIDCRNVYRSDRLEGAGFTYDSFGRGRVGLPEAT
jgi:UDPglucose 6-dehydrogenase